MKQQVMTRAWEIAREAVENFGGKVREFFKQSLVIAWAEIKNIAVLTLAEAKEKVNALDGMSARLWEKGSFRRLYVNHVWYVKRGSVRRSATYGYFVINEDDEVTEFVSTRAAVPYTASTMYDVQDFCTALVK